MKLKAGSFLYYLYVDRLYCLMSVRNTNVLMEYFKLLDVHNKNTLNDIQFYHFMHHTTDLKKKEILQVFDMLDWNARGEISFELFYMLVCILICNEQKMEKQFIYRHSLSVFELLDLDGRHTINPTEFQNSGFLFNLKGHALQQIFMDFDASGDEKLSYKEFQMFAICCIEKQKEAQRMETRKDGTEEQAVKHSIKSIKSIKSIRA
ncbi:EF-hand calcium-binding domain-containing protein 9 [Ascaphus truei]|uniref:EF-hand calcium-binding domain-containing protein 9 n=1 Tax=Ascaphus truei TaxID=8439 RepID=UPI003F599EBC